VEGDGGVDLSAKNSRKSLEEVDLKDGAVILVEILDKKRKPPTAKKNRKPKEE
jgi:hypothetical protein